MHVEDYGYATEVSRDGKVSSYLMHLAGEVPRESNQLIVTHFSLFYHPAVLRVSSMLVSLLPFFAVSVVSNKSHFTPLC